MNEAINLDQYLLPGYDWPCRGIKPAQKQKLTSSFMLWNPHCFVLNDPGTGKTLTSLWACDYIMSSQPRYAVKALILAPLSTLKEVWYNEIAKHMLGRRSCAIVHGSTNKRLKQLDKKVDFYVINYDGVKIPKVALKLAQMHDIKIVIIDESTAYSEFNTDRHKSARKLFTSKPFFWMLTGTPVIRSHLAAHGQARLMHGSYMESKSAFKQRTMASYGMHRWEPLANAYGEARKLLKPCIRVPRREMHDLPPSIPMPYEVPLSDEQNKHYKALKNQFKITLDGGGTISAVHEGALRLKLLQIAAGCVYDTDRAGRVIDCKPRLQLLEGMLRESEDKLLVFASFTCVLEMLYRYFKKKIPCAMVNGSVSLRARSKIFDDFQNTDEPTVIFADPGTMSHGLTLTKATKVVWWTPTDKAEVYVQANYRIDRPGKIKDTYIAQIMSTPVEREIFKRLMENQSLEGAMMKIIEAEQMGAD